MEVDIVEDDTSTHGTIDLAEATVLVASGFADYKLSKLSRSQAEWVFTPPKDEEDEDSFWNLVEDYEAGRCRVEPRAFMLRVRVLRNELYKFLGPHAPKRVDVGESS